MKALEIATRDFGRCRLVQSKYSVDNSPAFTLIGHPAGEYPNEPIATLSVWVANANLQPGEVCIKTWSENERIAEDALTSGLFQDTGRRVPTGFVEAQVWRYIGKEPKTS